MIKVINDSCIEVMKGIGDNQVDIIITSPPYNLKQNGGDIVIDSYKDNVPNDEYELQQIEFLNECYRILKPNGVMFYNHKNRYEKGITISPYLWVLKSNFKLNQEIIWNRKRGVDYNKTRYVTLSEKIFWLYKDTTPKLKQEYVSYSDVWDINRPQPKDNMGHKATFPVELVDRLIGGLDIDYSNCILLDPYVGTGTSLQVANHYNFKEGIGIDIDKKWCEIAQQKSEMEYMPTTPPAIKKSYKGK